eukprot:symbB.v1.2.002777.t1/scaffold141.1/size300911/28
MVCRHPTPCNSCNSSCAPQAWGSSAPPTEARTASFSSGSDDERMKKDKLRELVHNFTADALKGVECTIVERRTLTKVEAVYKLDHSVSWLKFTGRSSGATLAQVQLSWISRLISIQHLPVYEQEDFLGKSNSKDLKRSLLLSSGGETTAGRVPQSVTVVLKDVKEMELCGADDGSCDPGCMQSPESIGDGSTDGGFSGLQLPLAHILGPEKLKKLEEFVQGADSELAVTEEAKQLVFGQVREIVESLQVQLQESEPLVADLQEKADSLEEKRVLLERKVARAERDRDIAEQERADMEAKVKQLREETAPVIARFMEAEVLRSQIQVCSEDLVRLKQEVVACKEELKEGLPKLAEFEDDEAECAGAIAQLEASHTEEVALLKALHAEELCESTR